MKFVETLTSKTVYPTSVGIILSYVGTIPTHYIMIMCRNLSYKFNSVRISPTNFLNVAPHVASYTTSVNFAANLAVFKGKKFAIS